MATNSSVLAWRIPGTGKPDGLPSMGSHRVGHDWSDLAEAATCQLEKGPETLQRDLLEISTIGREKLKKKKKRKERPNTLYSLQLSKKKIQPLWPVNLSPPVWDLTLQASASDVTKQDTELSPAQTTSHPTNPAQPANNGATGKWIVLRHYPPNLRVHPRPKNNGLGTRLGGPGTPDHGSSDEVRDDPIVPELFQWWSPSSRPQVHPIQTDLELQVIGTVARHKVSFLIDPGAAFSLLTSFRDPLQPSEVAIEGVSGVPFYPQITPPLLCSFGKATLTYFFIIVPQCPMALMGCDLAKPQTSINLPFLRSHINSLHSNGTQTLSQPLLPKPAFWPSTIDPQVWTQKPCW